MRAVAALLPALAAAAPVAVPSPAQLSWQDLEIGAIIHFNLQTICAPASNPGSSTQRCQKGAAHPLFVPTPEAATQWNPHALNTDDWARTAKSFGAKYIILVADHMSGFALWNTKQHNFSIANTLYKGGGADVVSELLASCKKFGLKLGFFYSVHFNWYLGVNNFQTGQPALGPKGPVSKDEFISNAKAQLKELVDHFGSEGPLEVWFDGGVGPYGAEIGPWLRTIAPQAVCHSCDANFTAGGPLRWMGNEEGMMPLPSWGAAANVGQTKGDPHGSYFVPPSSDTVLREHYWFWQNNSAQTTKSTKKLVQNYLTSVGRASNLILDMGPDSTGAIPASDVRAYAAMGEAINCLFSHQLDATTSAIPMSASGTMDWELKAPVTSTNVSVVLMEDQSKGQLISNFSLDCRSAAGDWKPCAMGSLPGVIPTCSEGGCVGIGHKRVLMLAQGASALRLNVHSHFAVSGQVPTLRSAALFDWGAAESCV